ncbi:hypothetical protein [Oscillibacter sp.]|uniref:hypothetical protein n=1 Tax=Oscillibacter sp. TaxID=1945593 RepID=UPI0028973FB1|nr:hypothetical protein [Oscillibacter sp.]
MDWIDAVVGIAAIIAAFWAGRAYQKKRMVIMYDVRPQRLYAKNCEKTAYIENERLRLLFGPV